MFRVKPDKIVLLSSLITAVLIIWLLNMLKVKENGITGNVILGSGTERASLLFIFVLISLIAGGLTYMTLIYKQNNRY